MVKIQIKRKEEDLKNRICLLKVMKKILNQKKITNNMLKKIKKKLIMIK